MNEPSLANAFLFRQPILDRNQSLTGYQLSLDNGTAVDRHQAAGALCAAYSELGLRNALGNHSAYIGIAR